MRDKQTGELVAVKFIERGEKVCRGLCVARCKPRSLPWLAMLLVHSAAADYQPGLQESQQMMSTADCVTSLAMQSAVCASLCWSESFNLALALILVWSKAVLALA